MEIAGLVAKLQELKEEYPNQSVADLLKLMELWILSRILNK